MQAPNPPSMPSIESVAPAVPSANSFDLATVGNGVAVAADAVQQVAQARVVPYKRDGFAGFSPHVTVELVERPAIVDVPASAYYARGVMHWHGRWIPVLDLQSLLMACPAFKRGTNPRFAFVLAYTDSATNKPAFGAVALNAMPQTVAVTDADACALPNRSDLWPFIAASCFSHRGAVIPIVDTDRLFGSYHG